MGVLLAAQPAFKLQPLELTQASEVVLLESLAAPFDGSPHRGGRSGSGVPLMTTDTTVDESALVETIWD